MSRDAGPRVRGIALPDDIRHRMLHWDATEQMWRDRDLPPLNKDFGGGDSEKAQYMGSNHATYRIGRGMRGRVLPQSVYRRLPVDQRGPYLPVIIEACQENALSYEYRDGVTSYGAFTYSFVKDLRAKPGCTFEQAVQNAASTLKHLNYAQKPQIIGPSSIVKRKIPGSAPARKSRVKRKAAAGRETGRAGARRRAGTVGSIRVTPNASPNLSAGRLTPIPPPITCSYFGTTVRDGTTPIFMPTKEAVRYVGSQWAYFATYHVLLIPSNSLAQNVLTNIVESGEYFFFAFAANRRMTAFRSEIGDVT